MFLVCLDPDDEDLVWLHEWFRDSDAQDAHQQSSAFHRMMQEMPPLLAGPPGIVRIDPLRLHLAGNIVDESM
jgi:quinol monooxygenase YgiN